jgi:hypothetical protein
MGNIGSHVDLTSGWLRTSSKYWDRESQPPDSVSSTLPVWALNAQRNKAGFILESACHRSNAVRKLMQDLHFACGRCRRVVGQVSERSRSVRGIQLA